MLTPQDTAGVLADMAAAIAVLQIQVSELQEQCLSLEARADYELDYRRETQERE